MAAHGRRRAAITPLTQGPGEALRRAARPARRGGGITYRAPPRTTEHPHFGRRGSSSASAVGPSSIARSARPGAGTDARGGAWMRRSILPTAPVQSLEQNPERSTIARSTAGSTRSAGHPLRQPPHRRGHGGRQPFGGWKASSVSPGPRSRTRLCAPAARGARRPCRPPASDVVVRRRSRLCWSTGSRSARRPPARALLRASAASYALAWRHHFGREHEPEAGPRRAECVPLPGLPRPARSRGGRHETAGRLTLQQVLLAALTCGVPVDSQPLE